jgi:hypothetical protein
LDSLLTFAQSAVEISPFAHIAVSRLYTALGDRVRALAAVRRRPYMRGWPLYLSASLLEEGTLAEATGDRASAVSAFSQLLALRASPEPTLESDVQEIRNRLDRLSADR